MKQSILVLAPRYPYPVVGGDRLRIYQQCKELSKYYSLTLIALCESEKELMMPVLDDGVFSRVERIYHPKIKGWWNVFKGFWSKQPLQISYYRSEKFLRRARELQKEHVAIFSHLIRVGDMVKEFPGVKFLEMTDAISLNYYRIRESKVFGLIPWVYGLEYDRLKVYEKKIPQNFDKCFLVSEVDFQFLFNEDALLKERVSVVGNGVDVESLSYNFNPKARDLIFIGNMNTVPNMDAVQFMASEVLPKVRRYAPDVRLKVVGRIGPSQRRKLSRFSGIDVVGEVESIRKAVSDGGIGVCSMRLGAGVQNKLLEYMALGLPAVVTNIGLEGVSARQGLEVAVADTSSDFADEILKLLNNPELAEKQALAARKFVEANHGWSKVLEPMISVVQQEITANLGFL